MSRKKSRNVKQLPTWDLAIDECATQLRECEGLAAKLKVSLDYFLKRKQSGDPFPGIEQLRKRGFVSVGRVTDAETATQK